MKKIQINNRSIHQEDFFTFETSWIGNECIDFQNDIINIPILNIYTENKEVFSYYNIKEGAGVYIEQSFLSFEGVTQLEKRLAIHSKDRKKFIRRVTDILKLENEINDKIKCFELGGMGIFKNNTYDGLIKISALKCYFVIPENQSYRTDFKSLDEYNPLKNEWLDNLKRL